MKGLFYAFKKDIWNRSGKQQYQDLFLSEKQELYGEKHGRIQGTQDYCSGK